jgi:hypothetical protein
MSWYIECENGSRSRAHDTIEQARVALRALRSVQAQLDPNYSTPVRFLLSEDEVRPLDEAHASGQLLPTEDPDGLRPKTEKPGDS